MSTVIEQIDKDLPRTFPGFTFTPTGYEFQPALRRVLRFEAPFLAFIHTPLQGVRSTQPQCWILPINELCCWRIIGVLGGGRSILGVVLVSGECIARIFL